MTYSPLVERTRFVDIEYPAWVIVGYPAYVPEILDVVTMDDVLQDLAVREFAERTDLYSTAGTFADPQHVPPTDQEALTLWRAGLLQWTQGTGRGSTATSGRSSSVPTSTLPLQRARAIELPAQPVDAGTFDPYKLGVPPRVDWAAVTRGVTGCMRRHHSGELFVETLAPALLVLEKPAQNVLRAVEAAALADASSGLPDHLGARLRSATSEHLRKYQTGKLLEECQLKCIEANDPYRAQRQFLFDLLR